ncbi:disease resistance protein RUN1-like [Rosa chinensis]|uniref:disease resistance protein RUN1-like n=1 Tax=Rosa chinensis TaxID=74649 RepID=UPI000D0941B7|nr:disease resistance protein RUN1-like [Rosa chinensis]
MARSTVHEAFSSFSSSKKWMYDVFLSFRGEDTRNNFTGHLYMALQGAGISTFIDEQLRRGEDITGELLQAIQGSSISVIVFSRNYAESTWCLEELVKIMECRKIARQMVLPIFYHVDASDVRKQTGSFARAFKKHEEDFMLYEDKVQSWRCALNEAANLSGWALQNTEERHEAKFVRKIVDEITRQLPSEYLNIAVYPVGINSRVQDINHHLCIASNDVRMVGVLGMGGMGKTTVAKAIYNKFYHDFEGKSFLANVRETTKQTNGEVLLQEQLLSDILRTTKIKVDSVHRGINVIKKKLRGLRVLVIIDDIDRISQLNALAINPINNAWFGSGSIVLITTRDEQLLKQLRVDAIYLTEAMNEDEALELFSWHAFGNSCPDEEYLELSRSVVTYCGGLPLALEVLGCFLFGRSNIEWESALEKLERILGNDQVWEKLQISIDGLNKDGKEIFLDIACFFVGMDKNYVIQILDGCGFSAEIEIKVLLQRCLVTVDDGNKLMMHDLLQDMGREMVRGESTNHPGKRSRVWRYEDVIDVLTNKSGTEEVLGLTLNMSKYHKVSFSAEAFKNMRSLRLLQLNYAQLSDCYKYYPMHKLRWLCWHGFPLDCIPKEFMQPNLVAVDLQFSKLTQAWKDCEFLEKFKILNLSHCHHISQTPDFLKLPNLEQLILEDCECLSEVHESIGDLKALFVLNLRDCKMLKYLPRSFYSYENNTIYRRTAEPEIISSMWRRIFISAIISFVTGILLFKRIIS